MKTRLLLILFSCLLAQQLFGQCQPTASKGFICITLYDPICGCDCNTYGNSCEAEDVGITSYRSGECPSNCTPDDNVPDVNNLSPFPSATITYSNDCTLTYDSGYFNSGTTDYRRNNVATCFFLSSSATNPTMDYLLSSLDHDIRLEPGEDVDFLHAIDLTNYNVPAGTYYPGFVVDCTDRAAEDFEGDNMIVFTSNPITLRSACEGGLGGANCPSTNFQTLRDFYNSTNGGNWSNCATACRNNCNWDINTTPSRDNDWCGVLLNDNGCVETLKLFSGTGNTNTGNGYGVTGSLPPNFGDLTELEYLYLHYNSMSGELPNSISNMTLLKHFRIHFNNFSGPIPEDVGNWKDLTIFHVKGNNLSGELPSSMGNYAHLQNMDLSDNEFEGAVPSSFANLGNQNQNGLCCLWLQNNNFNSLPDLTALFRPFSVNYVFQVENNKLTFDDIIPNINLFNGSANTSYSPQDSVFVDTTITARVGSDLTIDLGFDASISDNVYTWFKNGTSYATVTGSNKLVFNDIQLSDAGNYNVQVTNSRARKLTLYGRTIRLVVEEVNPCRMQDSLVLVDLYDATQGWNWTNLWNLNTPMDTWTGIALDEEGCLNEIELHNNNLNGSLPNTLGNLAYLNKLDLSNNLLGGTLPNILGNISSLQWLFLQDNQFRGDLPIELGNLPIIQGIYLQNNQLSGCFPDALLSQCGLRFNPSPNEFTGFEGHNFTGNPLLPWQGDFQRFCNNEQQIGASCDDGNAATENDVIGANCNCEGTVPACADKTEVLRATICANEQQYELNGVTYNSAGTYTQNLQTFDGCDSTLLLVLDEAPAPDIEIIGEQIICDNGQTTLTVVGENGNQYLWSIGTTAQSITVAVGTYSVTATNTQGCETVETITVQNDTQPPTIQNCPTDIVVTANQTGFATVDWVEPTATDNCGSVNRTTNHNSGDAFPVGETFVTYFFFDQSNNANFCNFKITVLENECPSTLTETITDYICANETEYTLNGIVYTQPGTYTQNLTTAEGCDSILTLDLQRGALPDAEIQGINFICAGGVTVLRGVGGGTYQWSNGSNSSVIVVGPGTYSLTVTNEIGCQVVGSTTVTPDQEPPTITCPNNLNFIANAQGTATVSWAEPTVTDNCGSFTLNSTHESGNVFPIGTTTVTYTATDLEGNESQCSFDIIVSELPCEDKTATFQDFICINDPIYTINGITYTEPGTYTQDLQTVEGCDSLLTIILEQGFRPHANIEGDTLICNGNTTTLTGIGGSQYAWSNGETTKVVTVGAGTYTVTVTNAAGCQDTWTTIIVLDEEAPIITCSNNLNFTADAQGTATVSWAAPTVTDNCGSFTLDSTHEPGTTFPIGTTTVTYIAIDPAGNESQCSFDVIVSELPCEDKTATFQDFICINDPVYTINGTTYTEPGTYTQNLQTTEGCDSLLTIILEQGFRPHADIEGDTLICNGNTTVLTGIGGSQYGWSNGETAKVVTVGPGTYTVTVTNAASCQDTWTTTVVRDEEAPIITCPDNVNLTANAQGTATVNWAAPIVTDNCGSFTLNSSHESGSVFPVGTTTVTYTAIDPSGNQSQCSFSVIVAADPTNTCRYQDSLVLVDLYNTTNGANWTITWDLDMPISSWHGVVLNAEGCVTAIDLKANNLRGGVPNLELLYLETLHIQQNQLTGELPPFHSHNKLRKFRCDQNQLSGNLPEFPNSSVLQYIYCGENEFTGTLPTFVENPLLETISCRRNALTGNLPNYSYLSRLREIELDDNQLTGNIPGFTLANLARLELSSNIFSGSIPDFSGTPNIRYILLDNNNLTGEVPSALGNLTALQWLWLQENQLTGSIPATLGTATNLEQIRLNDNDLSGCYEDALSNICTITYNFANNLSLPWQGDFQRFCNGEDQFTASCNDGNGNTTDDLITADCGCAGTPVDACLNIEVSNPGVGIEYDYCVGTTLPRLQIPVAAGETVDWYDAPRGGNLILEGSRFLRPDQPGKYYAEIRNMEFGCVSTSRALVAVNERPSYDLEQIKYVCSAAEAVNERLVFFTDFGCDSIVNITKIYQPPIETLLTDFTCDPDEVGRQTERYSSQYDCDSLVITDYFYLPSDTTYLEATTCLPSEQGVFTTILTNQNGCDSTLITTVTLNPSDETNLNEVICEGETYSFGEENLSIEGNYNLTLQNQYGCDSIIRLALEVVQVTPPGSGLQFEFCEGDILPNLTIPNLQANETVDWYDAPQGGNLLAQGQIRFQPSEAGTYYAQIRNVDYNCISDGRTPIDLLVYPIEVNNGVNYVCTEAEVRLDTIITENSFGCPVLNITDYQLGTSPITYLDRTTCDRTQENEVTTTLQNQFGCDSTIITRYRYLESDTTYLSRTTCLPSEVGEFVETLTNHQGCDSMVITTVILNPSDEINLNEVICEGETYRFGEENLSTEGNYNLILQNQYGCDSIVNLALEVIRVTPPGSGIEFEDCAGASLPSFTVPNLKPDETIDWYDAPQGGQLLASDRRRFIPPGAGTFFAQIRNRTHGCLSLGRTPFRVTIFAPEINETAVYVCDVNQVGLDTTYQINPETGCDVMNIESRISGISPVTEIEEQTCDPEAVGRDTLFLINQYDCDSIVIINKIFTGNLQVRNEVQFTCNPSAVGLDSTYITTNGQCQLLITTTFAHPTTPPTVTTNYVCSLEEAGLDTLFRTNQFGCDSLIINNNVYATAPITTQERYDCEITTARIDTFLLTTTAGCDSTIIVKRLPAQDSEPTSIVMTTCDPTQENEERIYQNQYGCDSLVRTEYQYIGSDITYESVTTCDLALLGATTTDSLINANGCDSLIVTSYIVLPNSSETYLTAFTCEAKADQTFDTVAYQNIYGCDSLIITQFILEEIPITERTAFTCDANQIGRDTVAFDIGGCDSLVVTNYLNISVEPTYLNLTTCDPSQSLQDTLRLQSYLGCDSLVIRTFEPLEAPTPTIFSEVTCQANEARRDTITLSSYSGCDSLVIYDVVYEPLAVTNLSQVICDYQAPDTTTLATAQGCDSMVVMNYIYEPAVTDIQVEICEGGVYDFNGIPLTSVGIYTDTLVTIAGCDSIIHLELIASEDVDQILEVQICEGDSYEFAGEQLTIPDTYEHTFTTEGGCDSTVTLILESIVIDSMVLAQDTVVLLASETFATFDVTANDQLPANYEMTILPTAKLGTVSAAGRSTTYQLLPGFGNNTAVDEFQYIVCATDCPDYCDTTTVHIAITVTCLDSLINNAPNAFSPQSIHPEDQMFDPLAGISNQCFEQPQNAKLRIYNIHSELVYITDGRYQPWDGKNRNRKLLPTGTYYYLLEFDLNGKPTEPISGYVTLFVEE